MLLFDLWFNGYASWPFWDWPLEFYISCLAVCWSCLINLDKKRCVFCLAMRWLDLKLVMLCVVYIRWRPDLVFEYYRRAFLKIRKTWKSWLLQDEVLDTLKGSRLSSWRCLTSRPASSSCVSNLLICSSLSHIHCFPSGELWFPLSVPHLFFVVVVVLLLCAKSTTISYTFLLFENLCYHLLSREEIKLIHICIILYSLQWDQANFLCVFGNCVIPTWCKDIYIQKYQ